MAGLSRSVDPRKHTVATVRRSKKEEAHRERNEEGAVNLGSLAGLIRDWKTIRCNKPPQVIFNTFFAALRECGCCQPPSICENASWGDSQDFPRGFHTLCEWIANGLRRCANVLRYPGSGVTRSSRLMVKVDWVRLAGVC
eukprot:115255-Amorphochlora_amoeboformis.AAC.1